MNKTEEFNEYKLLAFKEGLKSIDDNLYMRYKRMVEALDYAPDELQRMLRDENDKLFIKLLMDMEYHNNNSNTSDSEMHLRGMIGSHALMVYRERLLAELSAGCII